MILPIEQYKSIEDGPVVILGNGPSMNKYKGKDFACPIIGINLSTDYWPVQEYYVTVAFDRLRDVAAEKIKAKKAVFTCVHKAHPIFGTLSQPVVYVDMALADDYAAKLGKDVVFDIDLTKPTRKTFGGLFATQLAYFLGFNPVYVVGFDGGTEHFKPYSRDDIPPEYHNACFWHVFQWLEAHPGYELYNCNKDSKITWFPYREPPLE